MTPAETVRLVTLVRVICPSPEPAEAWHRSLADLNAPDVFAAAIQLARRRCDVTARDVRAEVLARHERPPADDSALHVACPWCGAPPGEPCTVRGTDVRLRKAPAHPVRRIIAEPSEP
ncbi:hypothetical protein GCM10010399_42160 [Dactylosporangium fulvum]|uniref:DNA-binding phage zinc finger domain-containing protein n=1 Tax=Dactylosporangium fulvum TaxID=53359 RepID=A0ABY5VX21_9ACTN|nr:hypothetical protein [Dactylosporangium fulvum]UWP81604.1 hypothetical protein Dfulv_41885 [Dactylosporangium fulvum]